MVTSDEGREFRMLLKIIVAWYGTYKSSWLHSVHVPLSVRYIAFKNSTITWTCLCTYKSHTVKHISHFREGGTVGRLEVQRIACFYTHIIDHSRNFQLLIWTLFSDLIWPILTKSTVPFLFNHPLLWCRPQWNQC